MNNNNRSPYDDDPETLQSIIVECQNGYTKFKKAHNAYSFLDSDYRCNGNPVSFYLANSTYCDKTSIIYGMNIKDKNIIFADFCYDIRESKLIFVHYIAVKRSSFVSYQVSLYYFIISELNYFQILKLC